eukprot:3726631-Prorocentrum_lima.AAC.1
MAAASCEEDVVLRGGIAGVAADSHYVVNEEHKEYEGHEDHIDHVKSQDRTADSDFERQPGGARGATI